MASVSFSTGIFHDPQAFLFAWHHWGAYVGPSEMVRSGARLFRDVPAQYGLGPTVLIAAIGGQGCWLSVYYLAGLSTLLFAAMVAGIALNAWRRPAGAFSRICHSGLVLILLFFLDFLPTAFRRATNDTFSLWDAFPACDGDGCMVAVAGSQPRSGFFRMAGSASVMGVRRACGHRNPHFM